MYAHDCVKGRADRVDVGLLAALVPAARVEDVPAVQDQDQHVDLAGLTLLGRALLRKQQIERGV